MKQEYEYQVTEVGDHYRPSSQSGAEILQALINQAVQGGWRLVSCHPDFKDSYVSATLILERPVK